MKPTEYVKGIKVKPEGVCPACSLPMDRHVKIVDDGSNLKCYVKLERDPKSKATFGKFTGISTDE